MIVERATPEVDKRGWRPCCRRGWGAASGCREWGGCERQKLFFPWPGWRKIKIRAIHDLVRCRCDVRSMPMADAIPYGVNANYTSVGAESYCNGELLADR